MGKPRTKEFLDNFIGKKQGSITVLSHFKKGKYNVNYFRCQCDCGRIAEISVNHFLLDNQTTCGRNHKKYENSKQGYLIYSVWNRMKRRCYNPKDHKYNSYGARGIKVCDEWKNNYDIFYNWALENGYQDGLWIERIDNDGNYCPENCKWATRTEQMRNTRRTKHIQYNGEIHSLAEWCELLNIDYKTINSRLHKNWTVERAFETPTNKPFNGTR